MYSAKQHYNKNNYNEIMYKGISGYIFRYQHKILSPNYLINKKKVLEVGPGFAPHIKFKKLNFDEYHCVEINDTEDIKNYYKDNFKNVIFNVYDGSKIDYPNETFDRVIISHSLEHISDPENQLNELLRVLKPNGIISIALPCDNGLLWRFGRFYNKLTHNRKNNISDLDYDYFVANEHINTIFQLKAILKKKFVIKEETFLPFRIKIIDLNLIYVCQIYKE